MVAATRRRMRCRKCLDTFHFSVVPPAPFVLLLVMVMMLSSYLSGGMEGYVSAARCAVAACGGGWAHA